MRLIRTIMFAPIFAVGLPAIVILSFIVLIVENERGTFRSLCAADIRAHGFLRGIRHFMERVFVPNYKNHIQSFVLGAAGVLVIAVGLRGIGVLPVEYLYLALGVEFTLLTVWAIMIYYTPEEPEAELSPNAHLAGQTSGTRDLIEAMKELSTHIAFLERRLAVTEAKFEHLGHLDSAMQTLSTRLNLLVSDQFSLRVKREFDQILADLVQRTSGSEAPTAVKSQDEKSGRT